MVPGFGEIDEASEDDDSEDSEDENLTGAPRTVWAWGGSFTVYQSRKKPGGLDLLEALKGEADKNLNFATFLIKYLYAVHQVTPPCPQLDPQLLTEAKELWGLHTGKRAIEALTAKEEDTLDEVLGRPPVVRCRVCHKPSETGVHPECQKLAFSCTAKRERTTWVPDHEMAVYEQVPERPHRGAVACHPS